MGPWSFPIVAEARMAERLLEAERARLARTAAAGQGSQGSARAGDAQPSRGTGHVSLRRRLATIGVTLVACLVLGGAVMVGDQDQSLDAQVKDYREAKGVEADVIVERRDGSWAGVEVKLGPGKVDEGADSLLRVESHIDANKQGNPAFHAVITGWGFAYRRPDDVPVIPIGALAP